MGRDSVVLLRSHRVSCNGYLLQPVVPDSVALLAIATDSSYAALEQDLFNIEGTGKSSFAFSAVGQVAGVTELRRACRHF